VSIRADDEIGLRLALETELDDVTPRDGLAGLVIARYRKGRRRRFAGMFGLFVVFAGIGVPIGVAGASGGTSARSGPVVLKLGAYALTLPGRYHLTNATAMPCAATATEAATATGAASAAGSGPGPQDAIAAAASPGVCVVLLLTPSVSPKRAAPEVPRGAREVTVGHYRGWLVPPVPGAGTALVVEEDAAKDQELVIGAEGLSRTELLSLVSSGLRSAA